MTQTDESTGFIVKASSAGDNQLRTMGLRQGFEELVVDLADAFDFIPASVTLFSLHNGTRLMVLLGSQGDLDVVLAEAMEWGSHVVTIEVSGIPARRSLDGLGCLAGVAATASQLFYLYWMITESGAGFTTELQMWSIMIFALLVNLGSFAYLLDDETDKNHPFRLWIRPLHRRAAMLILSPFSGEVLPLVACKAFGLDAPIRSSTRDGIVKYGWFMMVAQDLMVLLVMWGLHTGETPVPMDTILLMAISLTLFSVLLNLPRRVSHFVLGYCDAAYREKEELADDAKISFFAAQKIGASKNGSPVKDRPEAARASPPMNKRSPNSAALTNGGASKPGASPPQAMMSSSCRAAAPPKQRPVTPVGKGSAQGTKAKGGKSSKSML